MGAGTVRAALLLSNLILYTSGQYYAADTQYYYWIRSQHPQYWPSTYQQQNVRYPPQYVPIQTPQTVIRPLRQQPRAQPQYVPEKKPPQGGQGRVVSSGTYEFDIPPAPSSRFLPDEERTKVLSFNKQGRPEHVGIASVSPQQRIRLVTGATNNPKQGPPPPQIQIHHVQVPRILQKTISNIPSQMTHFIANTTVSTQPTSTTASFTQTTKSIITTSPAPITEHQTEAITRSSSPSDNKKVNPNKVFLDCCLKKKVAKTCEAKCNFDNINKKTISAMFIGVDSCPRSYGLDLFSCAAQENDHTTCCRSKNVQRTSAGAKCLAFCNLKPESHFQADASYLPCWAVLNDVKNCFREAIVNGGPM